MKLYAVVIGRKHKTRYVAYEPFVRCDFPAGDCPVAVYPIRRRAKEAKEEILKTCAHKDVYVITFLSKP